MSVFSPFRRILEESAGLDAGTIGSEPVARAVAAGMTVAACATPDDYLERVSSSERERERFIEAFLVHETWFFRDGEPYTLLRRYLREKWLPSHPGAVFRVLSAPCSTGEEPYSIAISLLEEGISPGSFHIDAVDLSRAGLETARRAVYGPASFREEERPPEEWFEPSGKGLRPKAVVREAVWFHRADLREPCCLGEGGRYDVIFCRNMIVYLSPDARKRVWTGLNRLLAPDGLLFAGSAEVSFFHACGLEPVKHSRSFALRRPAGESVRPTRAPKPPPVPARPSAGKHAVKRLRPVGPVLSSAAPPVSAPSPSVQEELALTAIRSLADRGELEEALSRCERLKETVTAGAGVYVLAGLVLYELNRLDASEENLLKAVYLDPRNFEALVHLGLLYHRRGNASRATLYRKWSERVKDSG